MGLIRIWGLTPSHRQPNISKTHPSCFISLIDGPLHNFNPLQKMRCRCQRIKYQSVGIPLYRRVIGSNIEFRLSKGIRLVNCWLTDCCHIGISYVSIGGWLPSHSILTPWFPNFDSLTSLLVTIRKSLDTISCLAIWEKECIHLQINQHNLSKYMTKTQIVNEDGLIDDNIQSKSISPL